MFNRCQTSEILYNTMYNILSIILINKITLSRIFLRTSQRITDTRMKRTHGRVCPFASNPNNSKHSSSHVHNVQHTVSSTPNIILVLDYSTAQTRSVDRAVWRSNTRRCDVETFHARWWMIARPKPSELIRIIHRVRHVFAKVLCRCRHICRARPSE